jgi:hypothetical protein
MPHFAYCPKLRTTQCESWKSSPGRHYSFGEENVTFNLHCHIADFLRCSQLIYSIVFEKNSILNLLPSGLLAKGKRAGTGG